MRLLALLLHAKEHKPEELIRKLYPDEPNPAAYYALRKRLFKHLTDFLLLRQRQHDATATTSVRGQLTLAQYLFGAGVPRLAWTVLRKAEKLALDNEQYEPLNAVYNVQIEHAHSPHAEPLAAIIERRHRNKKAADEEERAGIADALLRQRLAPGPPARAAPRCRVDELVRNVLTEYDLQEAFARSPSLLCRLLSIARHAHAGAGRLCHVCALHRALLPPSWSAATASRRPSAATSCGCSTCWPTPCTGRGALPSRWLIWSRHWWCWSPRPPGSLPMRGRASLFCWPLIMPF
ncbi:MAG: hypothetical protein WKG07_09430 [Hymenobacter sp.]